MRFAVGKFRTSAWRALHLAVSLAGIFPERASGDVHFLGNAQTKLFSDGMVLQAGTIRMWGSPGSADVGESITARLCDPFLNMGACASVCNASAANACANVSTNGCAVGTFPSVARQSNGSWLLEGAGSPIGYGDPYTLFVCGNDSVQSVANVLIGEVWLLSGQSNQSPLAGQAEHGWSEGIGTTGTPIIRR